MFKFYKYVLCIYLVYNTLKIHTWNKNNMTVRMPIQECKLYKFGRGQTSPSSLGCLQGARLCESNTALSATI